MTSSGLHSSEDGVPQPDSVPDQADVELISFLLCEDVRDEIGGAQTLVGVQRPTIVATSFPFHFRQLVFYLQVRFRGSHAGNTFYRISAKGRDGATLIDEYLEVEPYNPAAGKTGILAFSVRDPVFYFSDFFKVTFETAKSKIEIGEIEVIEHQKQKES